jgi:hypothetical protein
MSSPSVVNKSNQRPTTPPPQGIPTTPLQQRPTTPPLNSQIIFTDEPLPGSSVAEMLDPGKKDILLTLFSNVVSIILPENNAANDKEKEAAAKAAAAKAAAAEAAAAAAAAVQKTQGIVLETNVLSEKIKCIEYSIKKLELDLRLTNEDSIGNEEFDNVLLEIKNLSNNVSNTCFQRITIKEFEDNARMKRKMNSYAAMIKMASFICPVLAIANKSALMRLTKATTDITPKQIENTKSICSTIIMTMLNFASVENGEILETTSIALDLAGKGHDVGVIEAVYNAVGETSTVATSFGGKIGSEITKVYNDYIFSDHHTKDTTFYAANAIRSYFKIATKSQQIIATASLILLIMFTLLNVVDGKFEGLIKMINDGSTGLLEITNTTASSNGGKRTKSKAKTTKPPKTPTKPPKTPTKPPKTPTKPPKTPTKPPKTPKAVPKKKK